MATERSSAVVTNIEAILNAYKRNKAPFWKLRDLSGAELARYGYNDPDGANIDDGIEELEAALHQFTAGRFFVEMRNDITPAGAKNGFFKIMLDLGSPDRMTAGAGIAGAGGAVNNWLNLYLDEKIAGIHKDYELRRLQEEKEPGFLQSLLQNENIQQLLIVAASKFLGPGVAPAAAAPISGVDDEARLTAALHDIAAVLPNYIEVLEKLAAMAKNDPGKIRQLVTFL
jgi:hypothetical protein